MDYFKLKLLLKLYNILNNRIRDLKMKLNILFLTINDISVLEFMGYSLEESLPHTSINILEARYDNDAIRILQENRIDLIIADMNIDTLESYEFYDKLQLNPQYKNIPFVFLSDNEEDQEIAFLKGICNFFLKPLNVDQLVNTLHTILKNSKSLHDEDSGFDENDHLEIIFKNANQIEELLESNNKEAIIDLTLNIKEEVKKISLKTDIDTYSFLH